MNLYATIITLLSVLVIGACTEKFGATGFVASIFSFTLCVLFFMLFNGIQGSS